MQPYRPQQPARVQCDSDDTCGTMERGRHACDATVRQSAARRPHKLGAARTRTATRARTQPRAERALHAPGERLYCRALAKLLNHALCDLPAARAWCQYKHRPPNVYAVYTSIHDSTRDVLVFTQSKAPSTSIGATRMWHNMAHIGWATKTYKTNHEQTQTQHTRRQYAGPPQQHTVKLGHDYGAAGAQPHKRPHTHAHTQPATQNHMRASDNVHCPWRPRPRPRPGEP